VGERMPLEKRQKEKGSYVQSIEQEEKNCIGIRK